MKLKLLTMSFAFMYIYATDGMLPSLFQPSLQPPVKPVYSTRIVYKKLRRITPKTSSPTYRELNTETARPTQVIYKKLRHITPKTSSPTYRVNTETARPTQVIYKKLRHITPKNQGNNFYLEKDPILEDQVKDTEEYFHKLPWQQRNNLNLINWNRPIAVPNFIQAHPSGRNSVPIESARQVVMNESPQFVMQKRDFELLQPQTPILNEINELQQPQNTPTGNNSSKEEQDEKNLENFFEMELDKFFSFEGISTETVASEEKNQQTEEPTPMEEDSSISPTIPLRKKNKVERILDSIFSKYEENKNLGEFVDLLKESLSLNLFKDRNSYIKKALQILETDDVTGEYSARFLKSFLRKKHSGRYETSDVNIFARIAKNMKYQELVRAYNLYPPIVLEPVNGTDIVSALKLIKFSGKQSKLEFLEACYEKEIKNLLQREKLP